MRRNSATHSAAPAAPRLITDVLNADELGLVLYWLPLAHDIAATAPTCHALCDAVKLALKLRPFSGEVVTLSGVTDQIAPVPGGMLTVSYPDRSYKMWRVWRVGAPQCVSGIDERVGILDTVAVLPGGTRFVSGSFDDGSVKLWSLDGACERTWDVGVEVQCIAALPDGVHFVVGVGSEVRLYHVDGALVHTYKGHTDEVSALAVTADGQCIVSGSEDKLVKVWSVASKRCLRTFSVSSWHTCCVLAVAAMPDGQRILSSSRDKTVCVWSLREPVKSEKATRGARGVRLSQKPFRDRVKVVLKEFMQKRGLLLSGSTAHTQEWMNEHRRRYEEAKRRLTDVPTSRARTTMSAFVGIESVLDAEACTALVATLERPPSLDSSLLTVLLDARKKLSQLAPEASPECACWWPEGTVFAIVAIDNQHALFGADKTVKLINVNDGLRAPLRVFTYHKDDVLSLSLLPDGLRFVSGSVDGTARIAYHGLAPDEPPVRKRGSESRFSLEMEEDVGI